LLLPTLLALLLLPTLLLLRLRRSGVLSGRAQIGGAQAAVVGQGHVARLVGRAAFAQEPSVDLGPQLLLDRAGIRIVQ